MRALDCGGLPPLWKAAASRRSPGRFALLLLIVIACRSSQNPSPMVEFTRAHERIAQRPLAGTRFTLDAGLPKPAEVLITPAAAAAPEVDLMIHFFGAAWLPMQAAEESGRPLVVIAVGNNPGAFPRVRELIAGRVPRVRNVYLTAFSAGHRAVGEVLKNHADDIHGVLLIDGLSGSYIPKRKVMAEGGKLDETYLEPFARFAERASRGEKRFVVTHSEIFPGTFPSTTETSDYLLKRVGVKRNAVVGWGPLGMQQISNTRQGNFIVLGYAGNSGPDHIDQFHAIGTFLTLLFE